MVTIVIPTMNRSDFLIRLLNYYVDTNLKHQIIIGDSSNEPHLRKTKEAIAKIGTKLNIVHRECPNLNHPNAIWQISSLVSTPYVVLICDDDFLLTESLEKCVDFLEKNSDYTAVHGIGGLFTLKESGAHGEIVGVGAYKQPLIEHESASERLISLLDNYSVIMFSVHRTEVWKKMWLNTLSILDRGFSEELLASCLSVISGKVKQIDSLHLFRQVHDGRYQKSNTYDRINSKNWSPSYQIFSECLTEELVRQDGINREKAQAIVKRAFWSYLSSGLRNGFLHSYDLNHDGFWKRLRSRLKRIWLITRYIFPVLRIIRTKVYPQKSLSLPVLLEPSSQYHSGFMPVYRAISNRGSRG